MAEEVARLGNSLYAACEEAVDADEDAFQKVFEQSDLMGMDVVPPKDLKKLMQVITHLVAERLFIPIQTSDGQSAWRLRALAEAEKYKTMTQEQKMVYEHVDLAGTEGVWHQHIRQRANIPEATLKKVLKELEAKRLITGYKNSENSIKKMWIKSSLQPSFQTTGGAWFPDNKLDEDGVTQMMAVVMNFIKEAGTQLTTAPRSSERMRSTGGLVPKKGAIQGSASAKAAEARGKKRSADDLEDASDVSHRPPSPPRAHKTQRRERLIPYPAGYTGYITAAGILEKVKGFSKVKVTEHDLKHLLRVLMYDNRIEEVSVGSKKGYRPVRIHKHDPQPNNQLDSETFWEAPRNGMTEVPCGKCPVFELCEEGGPVWAGGCEYFDKWLLA